MGDIAATVGDGTHLQPFRVLVAMLAAVPHLAFPTSGSLQRVPEILIEGFVVARRGKGLQLAADYLLAVISSNIGKRRVDHQDPVIDITNHDRVPCQPNGIEGKSQAQALLAHLLPGVPQAQRDQTSRHHAQRGIWNPDTGRQRSQRHPDQRTIHRDRQPHGVSCCPIQQSLRRQRYG